MKSNKNIVGVQAVNKALDNNKRVFAVGTSSMKTLETAVSASDRLKSKGGWTDKFIFPPYEYQSGAQAIQDLADRKTWGKVVVRVGE